MWKRSLSEFIPADDGREDGARGAALRPSGYWLAALAFLLPLAASWPASADFRVCNRTKYLLNIAIGYGAGQEFATEGWWSVTPNSCARPVKDPLAGRYVYLYATDVDGADVLRGSVSMCIDRRKFKIFGITDCWRRGLAAVNFEEIDTFSSAAWTVFLSDPSK
jgi:uncharacterized membrane protein